MKDILSQWTKRYFSDPEAIGLVLVLAIAIFVLKTMGNILTPLLLSLTISYILAAIVKRLDKLRVPHLLSVIIIFVMFLGLLLLALLWLLPLLWQQLVNLFNATPEIFNRGQTFLLSLHDRYPDIISIASLQQIVSGFNAYLANVGKFVLSVSLSSITSFLTIIVYLVLVPLLVFFFLKDGKDILNWLGRFLPTKRTTFRHIWGEVNGKIGSYIFGKVIEMLVVAVVTVIVFAVMGLQYAILLGSLVGLSVIVPYVGIVVVTIPVVIVALMEWGWAVHFLYFMLAYAAIVTLDANVLVPMLFAEALDLHPVAIILAILIFGSLGGFWGIFFAIPLVTLAHAIYKDWPRA